MNAFLKRLWRDESGAETAEWLVIAAILVAVGAAVYGPTNSGALFNTLSSGVTSIGNQIPQ